MSDPSPSSLRGHVRLIAALLQAAGHLPLRVLHAIGAAASVLPRWARTREARVSWRNLELAFPALDARARRRLWRETMAETARGLVELAWIWGRPPREALALVREVRGAEHLDAAFARGRGVLIAAPHLGAWELLNLWLSARGPLAVLYRRPKRPEFEALLNRARSGLGARPLLADRSAVRVLLRTLAAGEMVGILPDQRPKKGEGVAAPFFGHPANTMTLFGKLAQRTGATVLIAWAERLPRGAGFRIHLVPGAAAIADADPAQAATALNAAIESCVRESPAQYQWTYKRYSFRTSRSQPDPPYD